MKFIITGGGTGGHVYPAIAIAESLKRYYRDVRFLYVGVRGRAEEKIVPQLGYEIRFVAGAGLLGRSLSPRCFLSGLKLLFGVLQGIFIHLRFKPDAVIGTGGYVSVPAVMAAVFLRWAGLSKGKIFIHEQNFAPGRWNRIAGRLVDRVWVSLEGTKRFFPGCRVEFTGYPIRSQISRIDRLEAREKLGVRREARVVFFFGGSQGSRSINRAVVDALPYLLSDTAVEVFHGTGGVKSKTYDPVADIEERLSGLSLSQEMLGRYHRKDYYHDIQYYYSAADLVVCRAGAGTLNEICCCGKPSLIIPKSSLIGEHQVVNALALAKAQGAEVIFERPVLDKGNPIAVVTGKNLADKVLRLLYDEKRLEAMAQHASEMARCESSDLFTASVANELEGKRIPLHNPEPSLRTQDMEFDPVRLTRLSPYRVLALAQEIAAYDDGRRAKINQLVEMFRYFADGYLVSPSWQIRNIGVKLIGLLKHTGRRELLLALAADRTPVPLWKRLLSGDFKQVGFIRRNAIDSLARLGIWDEDFRNLLIEALTGDPYYEVRGRAGRTVIAMRKQIGACPELARALELNLGHWSLEVRWTVLEALGAVAPSVDFLDTLQEYFLHPNWLIRQALVMAIGHLLERGLISPEDKILDRLETLIPTCTDFIPTFPLKRTLSLINNIRSNAQENGDKD